jgi:hypothetical protein
MAGLLLVEDCCLSRRQKFFLALAETSETFLCRHGIRQKQTPRKVPILAAPERSPSPSRVSPGA